MEFKHEVKYGCQQGDCSVSKGILLRANDPKVISNVLEGAFNNHFAQTGHEQFWIQSLFGVVGTEVINRNKLNLPESTPQEIIEKPVGHDVFAVLVYTEPQVDSEGGEI